MRSIVIDKEAKEVFVKLHIEEVFNNIFLGRNRSENKGIYQGTLHEKTFTNLEKELSSLQCYTVYFMFSRFTNILNNSYSKLSDIIRILASHDNEVRLFDLNENCYLELKDKLENVYLPNERDKYRVIKPGSQWNKTYQKKAKDALYKLIESKILECRLDYNDKSPSSPVRLKYYISIKRMLEDTSFFCMAMYELARILVEEDEVDKDSNANEVIKDNYADNSDIVLLATSMNGVTISAILSQLLEIEVIKIDHLGPSNELFPNSFQKAVDKKKRYFIISDVICMGREISDAKAVLKMHGIQSAGSIAVVNIVPIGEKSKDVRCLYNIDKANNEKIQYQIETDLRFT